MGQGGMLTPPESPKLTGGENAEKAKEREADELAERICADVEASLGQEGKWEFLRTRFRRVEGDVLGGEGITLDAVKW